MTRVRVRLATFAAALLVLFAGGYAAGTQFPHHTDEHPPAMDMDMGGGG